MILTDSGGKDFEQPPVGTHIARCIKVIDLGTQRGEYQGKATSKRQLILGWELPNELISEGDYAGKPFTVSRFYTASLSEKANLRADLANWRGRDFTKDELSGFDPKNILGKPCMLSLTLNEKGKVRVTGVMAPPKGTNVPPVAHDEIYFSLEPDEFNDEDFEAISPGIKKMIELSPEYAAIRHKPQVSKPAGGSIDDMDDDIPF